LATVAHYGPDDQTVTKIAVGVFEYEDAEPILKRWIGPDVMTDPETQAQIANFLQAHGVQQVVATDGVIGCPHEEGIDFPEGQECPYCPFWRGKQGIQVTLAPDGISDEHSEPDPYRELRGLTRRHIRLVWEGAQSGAPLSDEDARLVQVMREHPEYTDLWGRLDELSDEELERTGTNPIAHIIVHQTIENQIAGGEPREVRRVVKKLMRQGLSRHEAIHRVGSVLAGEIYYILKGDRPFDESGYVRQLRQLVR
jgi:hypothetical protein